jgi:hypothetical protein
VSAHLTDRDRELTRLVGRHRVLTTDQLTALRFSNLTTARHRLSVLVRLGVLRRFRPHREPGSAPWHYVLGPVGAAMLGQEDRDEKKWLPQVRADRRLALERSQRLGHMTRTSWFFVALAGHARENGGELAEWLNEAETRFLLEYDTGSESLPALAGKLDGYQALAEAAATRNNPRRARSCCSASSLRAASSLPAAHSPPPGRPPRCGSPRRRSTRARLARPGRCGCRC